MTEKRFKVAVYDDGAINGFAVLDLQKPNQTHRLKYENVYIGSKEGCEIVCKFGNSLADENEQLKQKNHQLQESLDYNGQYILAKKKKGAWRNDLIDDLKNENRLLKKQLDNNEEKPIPRIQNITQLTRFSTELNLKIPITIFHENSTQFKEQQKSLKNLKEDPQLKIIENNEINELEKINGCPVIEHYKIISIKMRE